MAAQAPRLPPALAALAAEVPAAGPALADAYYQLVHERCAICQQSAPNPSAADAAAPSRGRSEDAVAFLAAMEARRAERDEPESQHHVVGWCASPRAARRSRVGGQPSLSPHLSRFLAGSCTRR